jgi:hypothetical protein
VPLPAATAPEDLQGLLFQPSLDFDLPPPAPKVQAAPASETLLEQLAAQKAAPAPSLPDKSEQEQAEAVAATLQAMVVDSDSSGRSAAVLFQDFTVRLRMAGVAPAPLDLPRFARRLAMARAGIFTEDPDWQPALDAAQDLPEDMLGPFLLLARAARDRQPTPSDEAIAQSYGTASLGRARRLLSYIESRDLIVTRTDLSGKRSIAIPRLGWSTAAA